MQNHGDLEASQPHHKLKGTQKITGCRRVKYMTEDAHLLSKLAKTTTSEWSMMGV